MAAITLEKIVKTYGAVTAIHGIDLQIADGEFIALVGPSGCGKSTLLRMIAGLEEISGGRLTIGDRLVNAVEPKDRDIAMVFQDYALYPHMSVRENIGFGLKMRGLDAASIARQVDEAAQILQIEALLERRPAALSGGQRQRVAMGRAIVRRPKAFLFDEPLSNLDAKLRVEMRTEIKRLHEMLGRTTIYVTHDQVEALTLADRVVILKEGRIQQVGAPLELYNAPANQFVAEFIGSPQMNMFSGRISHSGGPGIDIGPLRLPFARLQAAEGTAVSVGIRPESLVHAGGGEADFISKVEVFEPLGSDTFVSCRIGDRLSLMRLAPEIPVARNMELPIRIDRSKLHVFDAASGARIAAVPA